MTIPCTPEQQPPCNTSLSPSRTRLRMATSNSPSRLGAAFGIAFIAAAVESLRRYVRGPIRKTPPLAEQHPHTVLFGKVEGVDHGDPSTLMDPPVQHSDPYFWIRDDDRTDPQVLEHLRQENAYTNYMTLGTKRFARSIYREFLSHYAETDSSYPAKKGSFVYYSKTLKGKSYKYYCRRPVLPDASFGEEVIILDVNNLAAGQKHCDVGTTAISPDGNILAYSVDNSGYETYEVRFLDLTTGNHLEQDVIPNTTGSIDWGRDNSEVYYQTFDDAHRPHKAWRHKMKTYLPADAPDLDDLCLYTEVDTEFTVYASKSRSGRFVFISSYASTLSEHRFVDLDDPKAGVQLIRERQTNVLYDVAHAKDNTFYIVTNAEGATNFKVMVSEVGENMKWTPFIPYDPKRKVNDMICFKNFVILSGRQGGYKELWVIPDHDPQKMYLLPLEEAAHVVSCGTNLEYDTGSTFRYVYSSLTTPSQDFEYDLQSRNSKLLKEVPVPHYDRSLYKTERVEAVSPDGTSIPMSIVYNTKAVKEGANRLHLYGYGSYELSIDPSFSMTRLPLLDRGVVYAIAHIRGGGEFGREWYEAARFETKVKTFEDFCACAEKLIKDGRTNSDMLSIEGRSAGGLLMGAVMNMRPELFKAVIAGVPFVDVMNTMSDPSIPLTTGEWQEWGNPHQKKYYDAIRAYCPYTNVGAKPYPATLILAGLYDPRVLYSEPSKWAAKLRKMSTSNEPILLKVDMSSGHFSASNRYAYLKERSFETAWLIKQLEAEEKSFDGERAVNSGGIRVGAVHS